MAANITLRVTAVPKEGESQETADVQVAAVFGEYPAYAIAEALSNDIWTNTDAGWLGLKVEILDANDDVTTS